MNYLKIGKASDIEDEKQRRIYRAFEIFPGLLSWLTLGGAFLLSWLAPFVVSYVLVGFVVFWLVRTIYLSFHLWSGFKTMQRYRKTDWMKKLEELDPEEYSVSLDSWKEIYHIVVLPNYKEPMEVMEESLEALVESDYPKERLVVVLSFEQRAGEQRREVARVLKKKYEKKFFKLLVTFHPDGLPGEIPGHGSNDAWAAKQVKKRLVDPLQIPYEKIIISSFDVDTRIYERYFSRLTYVYLTTPNPTRSSYQPVPLYNNNIWNVPFFSRVSSFSTTFWWIMCQERPDKLVSFSSHAMSFKALVEVGYKQKNIIADDSRIFYQCFFKFDGDYRVKPLFYPISMDANLGKNPWETIKNMYRQKKRWGYGAEDIPYFLYGCLKNKRIPLRKKISRGSELIIGHWTWATTSLLIFALGWLPVFLGGKSFHRSLVSYSVPHFSSRVMTFAMLGLITSVWFATRLLPSLPRRKGKMKYISFLLGWFIVPLELILFDSLPALEAQTRIMIGKYLKFWVTPKSRKE